MDRKCFVCGDALIEHDRPAHKSNNNYYIPSLDSNGLVFEATGNYGSTIFDPASHQILRIFLCDNCVTEGARVGLVEYLAVESQPDIVSHREKFDPDKNYDRFNNSKGR